MDEAPPKAPAGARPAWFGPTVLVAAALAVRAVLVPLHAYLPGVSSDERIWISWMQSIHEHGVLNVLRTTTTSYPGYQWVLWLVSLLYEWAGGSYSHPGPGLHLLVKTPSLLGDALLMLVTWHATSDLARGEDQRRRLALTATAVIAFQPAILYDGAVWAQVDAAMSGAMLLALLLAARDRPGTAWAVWGLALLIKPQPVQLLPVLAVLTLRTSGGWGLLRGAGGVATVTGLVLGPWILHGDAGRLATAYGGLMGSNYGRLSVSAWNIWWLADRFGGAAPGDTVGLLTPLTYRALGILMLFSAGVIAAAYLWARTDLRRALIAGSYMAIAFYTLPTSMHERYMLPLLALMLPVAVIERRWLWLYVPASATIYLNMYVIAPSVSAWSGRWVTAPFVWGVASLNVAMFIAISAIVASGARAVLPELRSLIRNSYPFNHFGRTRIELTVEA
jgi:hypothetical protein